MLADPHGGDLGVENPELPNDGVFVAPKVGAPNAVVEFEAAGDDPKAVFPKATELVGAAVEGVPHTDCRVPRPEGAPKPPPVLGPTLEDVPNAGFETLGKDDVDCGPKAGAEDDSGALSAATRPG